MNLDTIFPSDEAKNEAMEHFRVLKDNPDWVFLVEKLIKTDIEDISERILDPKTTWKEGEEGDAKRQRAYWIILSELPENLINALMTKKEDVFTDNDPYYKNTEEMKPIKKR